ncbi:unnamed protein product [Owenia fusiformis]|uniref:Uncharacterized protein n=1 Tax=Owenia fusiformis TaxID=6347 RepID=A0A8S4NMF3_OWEFU|nr:unnamed protein product [Owenia fusiformis]
MVSQGRDVTREKDVTQAEGVTKGIEQSQPIAMTTLADVYMSFFVIPILWISLLEQLCIYTTAYTIHNGQNKNRLENFTVLAVPLDSAKDPPCPPNKYYDWMLFECEPCGTCCGGNTPEPGCLKQGIDPAKACPYDDHCEPVEQDPTWISQNYWIVIVVVGFLIMLTVLIVCVLKKASIAAWYSRQSFRYSRQCVRQSDEENEANGISREHLLTVREHIQNQEEEQHIAVEEERYVREQARNELSARYTKAKERVDDLIQRGYSVLFSTLSMDIRTIGIATRLEIPSMPWKDLFQSLGLDPYQLESLEGRGPFEIGMDKLLTENPQLKVTTVLNAMVGTVRPGTTEEDLEPIDGCINALEYALDEIPPSEDKLP